MCIPPNDEKTEKYFSEMFEIKKGFSHLMMSELITERRDIRTRSGPGFIRNNN